MQGKRIFILMQGERSAEVCFSLQPTET